MANKKSKLSKPARSRKIIVILTTLLTTSVIGSLTGTYAWFEYSARAKLGYHGTAVAEMKSIQIGLYSEVELKDANHYNLMQDEVDSHLYWSNTSLDGETVAYFCKENGYGTTAIPATTSGKFDGSGDFSIKPTLSARQNYKPTDCAPKRDYVHIPLRFRSKTGLAIGDGEYALILTSAELNMSGAASKAARVHFSSNTSNFIFSPASAVDGHDIVGGPLDLDNDGFYDYWAIDNKQYLYGELEDNSELIYLKEPSTNKDPASLDDRSCFNSAHAYGTYAIDTENTKFAKAEYYGSNSVISKKELARTKGDSKVVALDMDIYVEGWDTSVNRHNTRNSFSLDLKFELQEI